MGDVEEGPSLDRQIHTSGVTIGNRSNLSRPAAVRNSRAAARVPANHGEGVEMSQANECQADAASQQFEQMSSELEAGADADKSVFLNDSIENVRRAATFTQARSVEGSLFQIGLAYEGLRELADELPSEFQARLRNMNRALYSAAKGIERSTGKRSAALDRMMASNPAPFFEVTGKPAKVVKFSGAAS